MGEFKQISREALRTEGFPKPPIDLTEEVMLSLSEEQRQILFDLADLCEKQGELIEKINVVKSNLATVDIHDEVSLKFLTLEEHRKLGKTQTKMATILNKALDCGMGALGIVQRNCSIFDVKP
ncbi:MAG: hypothetical protein COU82_02000 [Candidatus Portnoybacteria bacterium CG10_big_fil_rev_8_21_14_0_10_38_18]|uniref:Uncharacterized protein n=1 Tax=Candidatus Portnoybacteria bacterium CG10_big_fil_rev_8_21_14_0_10_38_18 TaxID=1974813 RepID=A0A2M8KBX7_9BACT|nr:MAG: hypothetical protein COU82_02000 [Candidatus Portnoybacteria bacterium CG10_big_fil_rev_8_21_14_0_10_38_18]